MSQTNTVRILLVEDDPGHARLIERNLRRAEVTNDVLVMSDGHEALDYLFTVYSSAQGYSMQPFIILLDLSLPGLDGYEVLTQIKTDPRTQHVMVVVFTTTDDPGEIARCYTLGCNAYVTKPIDYEHFSDTIRKLGWFLSLVRIPNPQWPAQA